MALVKSIFLGRASNKLDEDAYYRTHRAGTSLCYVKNPMSAEDREKLGKGVNAFVFGAMGRYIKLHAFDINESFNRTQKGSARNFFVKVNFNAFKEALGLLFLSSGGDLMIVTDEQITSAVESFAEENPQRIFRVYRTGYPKVYLRGQWTTTDNPNKKPHVDYAVLESIAINSGVNTHVAPMSFSANEAFDIDLYGSFLDSYAGTFKVNLNNNEKVYDLTLLSESSAQYSLQTKITEAIEVSSIAIGVVNAEGASTVIFQASLNGNVEDDDNGDNPPSFD